MNQIRVLVVDESIKWRGVLKDVVSGARDMQLVGVSPKAGTGLVRMRSTPADVLVLSADAPDMSAAEATRQALDGHDYLGVLLCARPDAGAGEPVIEALEAGAFDVVLKADTAEDDGLLTAAMARRLLPKIRTYSAAQYSRKARGMPPSDRKPPRPAVVPKTAPATPAPPVRRKPRGKATAKPEAVLIGISTGGPEALARFLPMLPSSFPLPIVIVQHMPGDFIGSLASALDRKTRLKVQEGRHGIALLPGNVYLASGGSHVHLTRNAHRALAMRQSDSPAENGFKPSADVLFRSAVRACRGRVVAVIMTGMGDDGSRGLEELKEAGGFVLAQDEESSVVWGMPGCAVKAGIVDEVHALDDLAGRVTDWIGT